MTQRERHERKGGVRNVPIRGWNPKNTRGHGATANKLNMHKTPRFCVFGVSWARAPYRRGTISIVTIIGTATEERTLNLNQVPNSRRCKTHYVRRTACVSSATSALVLTSM